MYLMSMPLKITACQECPPTTEHNESTSVSGFVDEGYVDQSNISIRSSSSETQLKRVFVPDSRENVQRTSTMTILQPVIQHTLTMTTPQPVPVRVTNRNQSQPSRDDYIIGRSLTTSPSAQQKRVLVLGDSILKGINSRGLRKGVKICSKPGATVSDIRDEISFYDLKSFTKIICIGGNDCASRVGVYVFQDMFNRNPAQ